jgi:redox-sensing transcriptional repressor
MKSGKIPDIAISRLSVYATKLAALDKKGVEVISSVRLADMCGINPAQIRKDLAYFGEFGVRGVGYYVKELSFEITKILGLDKEWRLGLVGVGNLGSALLRHAQFVDRGYSFVAAFERNPKRIGMQIGDVDVAPFEAINRLVRKKGVEIGVIALRPQWAQQAVEKLTAAGVRAILNFAPLKLHPPQDDVFIEDVDFTLKLDVLCYRLTSTTLR